jgi:hypothetical protein
MRRGEGSSQGPPAEGPGGAAGRSSWRRHRTWLIRQAVVLVVAAAVLRIAIVPGESCPPVSGPALQRAMREGAAWLVRGQRDDGRFLYGYFASRDEVSS